MKLVYTLLAIALAVPYALAQQPAPSQGDMISAQQKTIQELTQAWVGARSAYEASQREIAALQAKLAPPAPVGASHGNGGPPEAPGSATVTQP